MRTASWMVDVACLARDGVDATARPLLITTSTWVGRQLAGCFGCACPVPAPCLPQFSLRLQHHARPLSATGLAAMGNRGASMTPPLGAHARVIT